jgi:hypothetical protein
VTQPPRDDGMPAPIRPNTLSGAAEGSASPRPNRLSGILDAGARARLPGVSGRWSAVLLLVLFIAVAVVLPLALHRSAWVEAEIVVAAWFLIWTAVLAWLGFAGRTVDEDWGTFRAPRRLFGRGGSTGNGGRDGGTGALDAAPYLDLSGVDLPGLDGGSDDGGLGCLGAILAVVVAVGAIAAIIALLYFTIGYVIPLIAIALYTIVRAMLNHVAARGHVTQGNLPASLARGAFWAAVYTAPLAIAIWLLHVAL